MKRRFIEEICAEILRDVEERQISIRGAIEDRIGEELVRRFRSLILALCLEVVRRYILLDKIFEHTVGDPPRDLYRRNIVRIITYEAKYRSVSVDRLVRICRKNRIKVSRNDIYSIRSLDENEIIKNLNYEERLHVLHSIPVWLVRYILRRFVDGEKIIESFSKKLPTYVRCRIERDVIVKKLRDLGIEAREDPDINDAIIVDKIKLNIVERELGNLIYVQDKPSMLIAHIARNIVKKDNIKVLDICSAPGGKAIHVADIFPKATIIGIDISYRRLITERNLSYRYNVQNKIDLICTSALKTSIRECSPDIVIIDPDCSSIGKLSHSPEIRLWLREHHIYEMARLQYKIMKNILRVLRENIIIIYSTCTITFEENEMNIERICNEHGLELINLCEIFPKFCNIYMRGSLRLFPHVHNTGGYFIACIKK